MSKTQLIVLWAGIGILVLMGLFPPGTRGGYDFILQASSVSLGRLCIEWVIVVLITGGLIYTLKVDPDLMLKIPCLLSSLLRPRSYQEILKDAKEAKHTKHNLIVFWVIVLVFLLFALVAIRLSTDPPSTTGIK
jgi:hypothetical protein